MNRRQILAMWCGVAAILALTAFPPTLEKRAYPGSSWKPVGLRPIFTYLGADGSSNERPDYAGLLLGYGLIALVCGAAIVTLADRRPRP